MQAADGSVEEVSARAQGLYRQGRIDDAEAAFSQLLRRVPDHIEALNVVAMGALRRGQLQPCLQQLRQAQALAPEHALTNMNLGLALESGGDVPAALNAFERVLAVSPDNATARLHKGGLLEHLGERYRALVAYARAIHSAQSQGRWLNAETTPPGLLERVRHAVQVVSLGRRQMLAQTLDPIRTRYGRQSLERVERCLAIYLGEMAATYPDPRQRPNFLYFPDLPPCAYFDRGLFSWMPDFEASTDRIRQELIAVMSGSGGREAVFHTEELAQANLKSATGPAGWEGYYFYRHGELRAENAGRCPQTLQALNALPLPRIREHAPEVMFSVLAPGTHLLPHRGVTNTRVVVHLPLIVPDQCALNVGGELHVWREGQGVVFDDTYEHEAWNRSDRVRVVLILDIWNPYLTDVEQMAVKELIQVIGDFRRDWEH